MFVVPFAVLDREGNPSKETGELEKEQQTAWERLEKLTKRKKLIKLSRDKPFERGFENGEGEQFGDWRTTLNLKP